jgi:putative endonuclease
VVEHKEGVDLGFTYQYNVHKLVYYEQFERIVEAIKREKQLKNWKRAWKDDLISSINPEWEDLYDKVE